MAKNKDTKFANDYHIPVEIVRNGLPQLLRQAPDDEVRGGNLIRVATASGPSDALSEQPPGSDALQVYIVSYIAPKEAQVIESMAEDSKEPQAESGGAAAAASPPFVIVNERVLQAKVLALMAMKGEIDTINIKMEEVRLKEEAPYYNPKTPVVDYGLAASERLMPLKQAYFARRALAGHFNVAKKMLKKIDHVLFKSLFQSFPMTSMEEQEQMTELAAEYQQEYPQYNSQALSEIVQQILGLLAFVDFQDKKRLLTCQDLIDVSSDRSKVLKLLKKQKQRFKYLISKQTLIGAESVNFLTL